MFSTFSST
jgi:hypothetical protein